MIEIQALPALFIVAAFTFFAQTSLMAFFLIVLLVACDTFVWQLSLINRPFLGQVTTVALGWPMFAAKHVVGVDVVVEAQLFPALVSVATFALVAVTAFVGLLLVNFLVTCVAFERGVLISPVEMAFLAFHVFVLAANKREVGFFVIEYSSLPVLFVMATGAFLA